MTRSILVLAITLATTCFALECKQLSSAQAEFALALVKANKNFSVRCANCSSTRRESSKDVKVQAAERGSFELRRRRRALNLSEVYVNLADGSERRLSALVSCPTYANKNEEADTFGDGAQLAEFLRAPSVAGCGGPLVERLFEGHHLALPGRFSLSTFKPDAVGVTVEWASPLGELVRIRVDEEATSTRINPECSKASRAPCVAFDTQKQSAGTWMVELVGFSKCSADAEAIRASL